MCERTDEFLEQNPECGEEEEEKEEEEEEEEVERGSVGRLRGMALLHNQLSRVFSCFLFLFTFFAVVFLRVNGINLFFSVRLVYVCPAVLLF